MTSFQAKKTCLSVVTRMVTTVGLQLRTVNRELHDAPYIKHTVGKFINNMNVVVIFEPNATNEQQQRA